MTVKDLIAKLLEHPMDAEVFTLGEEVIEGNELGHRIYKPYPIKSRFVQIDKHSFYTAQRACEKTKDAKKCVVL